MTATVDLSSLWVMCRDVTELIIIRIRRMRICNYYVGNETVFAVTAEEQAAVIRDAVVAAAGPDQDIVDET